MKAAGFSALLFIFSFRAVEAATCSAPMTADEYTQCISLARGCSIDEYRAKIAAEHGQAAKVFTLRVPAPLSECPAYRRAVNFYLKGLKSDARLELFHPEAGEQAVCGAVSEEGRASVGLPEKVFQTIVKGCVLVRPGQTAGDAGDSKGPVTVPPGESPVVTHDTAGSPGHQIDAH